MVSQFDAQAQLYNVYPISNMGASYAAGAKKFQDEMARRKGQWSFPGPVSNIAIGAAPPIANRPFQMRVQLDLPATDVTGPVFVLGGSSGGMGLYLKNGVPIFLMRDLASVPTVVAARSPLAAGASELVLTVDRPTIPSAAAKPVTVTISIGDMVLVSKQVTAMLPAGYGMSETFDIGVDQGSRLTPDYPAGHRFPGTIGEVTFNIH